MSHEEKLNALSISVFKMSQMHGNALDMMYIQLVTIIEILSEEGLITPEKWEEKLTEITKNMEEKIKEKMNDKTGNSGQCDGKNPNRPNANQGSGKIITPNHGIIIP